ncbi:MAG: rRNA methyltransferase [Flavobacteriales bacterium]|nr:rRNA methyltransferase [Flavobacteriales bacterium]
MGRRVHRPPSSAADAPLIPNALRDRLLPLLGEEVATLEAALSLPSPTSIRLNPLKTFLLKAEAVPWCSNGRYLQERPAFTFDPFLHAGAYYVQEPSSMLLERAVLASGVFDRDVLALDLCAAPGGKSTHLLSLLSTGSLLIANEIDATRRHVLAENIWKHGASNAVITGSDPADLASLHSCFDLILIDAPCSGEGMFRKDPFARQQWSPALVERCAVTQRKIVAHAWDALAPGGTLIYSTCTWERTENEEQLDPLIQQGAHCLELALDPAWGIARYEDHGVIGYRCFPHRLRGEGLFISVLRKPGEGRPRPLKGPHASIGSSGPGWLKVDTGAVVIEHGDVLHAMPSRWMPPMEEILRSMRVHAPGTPLAERKGEGWVPHAAAALSQWLDRSTFPEIAVDEAGALSYLRGEALPAHDASGPGLVTHQGLALGWVHGAGKRWNNRWPAAWRIRGQRSKMPCVPWSVRTGPKA